MACGDKYRHLIKNSLGHTIDNPCGMYCNSPDAFAWRVAAIDLLGKVKSSWNSLNTLTQSKGFSVPITLESALASYEASVSALPEPPTWGLPETFSSLSGQSIHTMETGVCLLEQFDDVTIAVGGTPPKVPGVTPPKKPSSPTETVVDLLKTGMYIAGGGLALYFGWKVIKKNSRRSETNGRLRPARI